LSVALVTVRSVSPRVPYPDEEKRRTGVNRRRGPVPRGHVLLAGPLDRPPG